MISQHLDKNNLHHAYLIEGSLDSVMPELSDFVKGMEIIQIKQDSFKIEDARNLKSFANEKGVSGKKVFIVSANNFLLEAQNTLLKVFEEPIADAHFFLIVPEASALLPTFISRFYFISTRQDLVQDLSEAEKFLAMPLRNRLEYIKELVAKSEGDEDENEVIDLNSTRAKSLKFLNNLESVLDAKMSKTLLDTSYFHHIFKVREFLRMPGSSAKTLMESVALVVPVIQ